MFGTYATNCNVGWCFIFGKYLRNFNDVGKSRLIRIVLDYCGEGNLMIRGSSIAMIMNGYYSSLETYESHIMNQDSHEEDMIDGGEKNFPIVDTEYDENAYAAYFFNGFNGIRDERRSRAPFIQINYVTNRDICSKAYEDGEKMRFALATSFEQNFDEGLLKKFYPPNTQEVEDLLSFFTGTDLFTTFPIDLNDFKFKRDLYDNLGPLDKYYFWEGTRDVDESVFVPYLAWMEENWPDPFENEKGVKEEEEEINYS